MMPMSTASCPCPPQHAHSIMPMSTASCPHHHVRGGLHSYSSRGSSLLSLVRGGRTRELKVEAGPRAAAGRRAGREGGREGGCSRLAHGRREDTAARGVARLYTPIMHARRALKAQRPAAAGPADRRPPHHSGSVSLRSPLVVPGASSPAPSSSSLCARPGARLRGLCTQRATRRSAHFSSKMMMN